MRYSSGTGDGWVGKAVKDRNGVTGEVTGHYYSYDKEWTVLEIVFTGEPEIYKVFMGNRGPDKPDPRRVKWEIKGGMGSKWVPFSDQDSDY